MKLQDKVVIITGASSGIGRALVYECARHGTKIVMAARRVEILHEMESELREMGISSLAVECDVSDEESCKILIDKAIERFGQIDVLINNAGISMRAMFNDLDLDVIRRVMATNFWGTLYCTKFALPWLLKVKGSVVGVVSIAGFIGLPGRTGYGAGKFAVRGFLNTLRVETRKSGLHVLVAAPGFTASNIRNRALMADGSFQGESPRKEEKMMSAERCAEIIVRGIIRRKREIIMTFVEGKLAIFLSKWWPSLVDKLSYSHMAKEPNSPFK